MSNKPYKRFPIKLWKSECETCCMDCFLDMDECLSSCIKNHITCNQCEYWGDENDERETKSK